MGEEKKVCEKCQPTTRSNEYHQSSDIDSESRRCNVEYRNVDLCMKKYNGNISNCQNEWNIFRKCFHSSKKEIKE
jgi:hypothetical protein